MCILINSSKVAFVFLLFRFTRVQRFFLNLLNTPDNKSMLPTHWIFVITNNNSFVLCHIVRFYINCIIFRCNKIFVASSYIVSLRQLLSCVTCFYVTSTVEFRQKKINTNMALFMEICCQTGGWPNTNLYYLLLGKSLIYVNSMFLRCYSRY